MSLAEAAWCCFYKGFVYLFEKENEKEKERQRAIFHLLVHSAHSRKQWRHSLEPGIRQSSGPPPLPSWERDSKPDASTAYGTTVLTGEIHLSLDFFGKKILQFILSPKNMPRGELENRYSRVPYTNSFYVSLKIPIN